MYDRDAALMTAEMKMSNRYLEGLTIVAMLGRRRGFPEKDGTMGLSRLTLTHSCYQSVHRLADLRCCFVFVDI